MTIQEAKKIYQYYNCSPFRICTQNFHVYMEYHRLEVAKWQEEQWKNEKIQEMYMEIKNTGKVETFLELYEIASEFHNAKKLKILCDSLAIITIPSNPGDTIELAETLLGKKNRKVRSGMVYWAYDLNHMKLAKALLSYVKNCLETVRTWDIYLLRRVRRAKHLHKIIENELYQS